MFYEINELKKHISAIDYSSIYIETTVKLGYNITIFPNVVILGDSVIENNVKIGLNSHIENSFIKEQAEIMSSYIYNSVVNKKTKVGPFSHIRDNSTIGENCKIGNFVEVKNSTIGNDTKASHLGYIGDSEIGKKVNFGCGAITVNYNGVIKQKTIIQDEAFIGSNSNLIAPITIGKGSYIACGSTISSSTDDNCFSIARVRQLDKTDYAKTLKTRYKKENE